MIRMLLLRVLSIFLIGYLLYTLHKFLTSKQKRKEIKKTLRDLESTDYDKEEWEKIKEELKKK